MVVPVQITLNHLNITEPGYAETADARFYAYEVTSKHDGTYWIVKDSNGWFFKGGNGRVDTLKAADSYVTAWISQLNLPGVTNLVLSDPRYAETRDGRFYATRTDGPWTVTDRQGQFQRVTCNDLAYADQIIGEITAEQPASTAFTCDMGGPTHLEPATHIVDAQVHIGVDDFEPLSWLICADLACHQAASAHAEAIGHHIDTQPITEAEAVTGLQAGAA